MLDVCAFWKPIENDGKKSNSCHQDDYRDYQNRTRHSSATLLRWPDRWGHLLSDAHRLFLACAGSDIQSVGDCMSSQPSGKLVKRRAQLQDLWVVPGVIHRQVSVGRIDQPR